MSIKKVVRIDAEIYAVELNSNTDIDDVKNRFYCNLYAGTNLYGKEAFVYTCEIFNERIVIPFGNYLVRENGRNFTYTRNDFKKRFKVLD